MIVITQNEIAPDYETISKYDPKCGKTPVEYYDEKLPPILTNVLEIFLKLEKLPQNCKRILAGKKLWSKK